MRIFDLVQKRIDPDKGCFSRRSRAEILARVQLFSLTSHLDFSDIATTCCLAAEAEQQRLIRITAKDTERIVFDLFESCPYLHPFNFDARDK
jgi:hypothetical protein